jgi:hypothetical protein
MATKAELEDQVTSLTTTVIALKEQVTTLDEMNENLVRENEILKRPVVPQAQRSIDLSSDYVVLDGKRRKIVLVNEVDEIHLARLRSEINTDAIAVVIE